MPERKVVSMNKKLSKDLSAVFTFLFPVIYIVLGLLLLVVDEINTKVFAYLLGMAAMVLGAALIIQYFLRRQYLDVHAYGFALGAFAAVIGFCIMLESDAIADSLTIVLNLCIMLTSLIKVQNAIQLRCIKSVMWIPVLVVSCIFLLCTVLIATVFEDEARDIFTYVVLICDGLASFANAIMLRIIFRLKATEGVSNAMEPV
ncbi:MAG: hypothetical protein E7651_01995 [Ruminococcaceae bacterium]|nr:hypothetical protein [Oscillospiraceae bacterium]